MAAAVEPEAWELYPNNWSRDGDGWPDFNAKDSLRRLEDPDAVYFLEEDDEDVNVRITDVNDRRFRCLCKATVS